MNFKSEKELEEFLLSKCKEALIETEQEVHRIIDGFLKEYYAEYDPVEYIRTYQFLNSLVMTDVKKVGNGYEAEVYFDINMINYPDKVHGKSGRLHKKEASDKEILENNLMGGYPHGWYEDAEGEGVWIKAMPVIDVSAINILEQRLKAQGIPIKKK